MENFPPFAPLDRTAAVPISPEFRQLPPPVILIGMHRSGTSLVAGMLSLLGVYLDPDFAPCCGEDNAPALPDAKMRENGYGEATCFRLLNEAILEDAGASWNHIEPFLKKRDDPAFRRRSLQKMGRATFHRLAEDFFVERRPRSLSMWGWKDPRTTLLLSYWLELFPEAKIIHVRRETKGVVESLMRRAEAETKKTAAVPSAGARLVSLLSRPQRLAQAVTRRLGLGPSNLSRPADLLCAEDCIHLSEAYLAEALHFGKGPHCYLEIEYEDILRDPAGSVRTFVHFLKLKPSEAKLECAARFVTPRNKVEAAEPSSRR